MATVAVIENIAVNILNILEEVEPVVDSNGTAIGELNVKRETLTTEPSHLLTVISERDGRTTDDNATEHVKEQVFEVSVWWMPDEGDTRPVDLVKNAIWAAVETALMVDIYRNNNARKTTVADCSRSFDDSGNVVFVITVNVDYGHPWGHPSTETETEPEQE